MSGGKKWRKSLIFSKTSKNVMPPRTLLLVLLIVAILFQIACKKENISPFEITSASCYLTSSRPGCQDSNLYVVQIEGVLKGTSNMYVFPQTEGPQFVEMDCGEWSKIDSMHCQRVNDQPKQSNFVYTGYFRCIPSNAFFGPLEFDIRSNLPSSLFPGGDIEQGNLVTVNCGGI